MPCDIGYRNIAKVAIPVPKKITKKFKATARAPEVDRDLLNKIGEKDPAFLEWMSELDVLPLFEEALRRAQQGTNSVGKLKLSVSGDGTLSMDGEYDDKGGKRGLELLAQEISEQFQMEILRIVAELLDYEVVLRKERGDKGDVYTLEGEKRQGQVSRYLCITKDDAGSGDLRFEHFASKQELQEEYVKFLGLAQRLGTKLVISEPREAGTPIAPGVVHNDFLRGR